MADYTWEYCGTESPDRLYNSIGNGCGDVSECEGSVGLMQSFKLFERHRGSWKIGERVDLFISLQRLFSTLDRSLCSTRIARFETRCIHR